MIATETSWALSGKQSRTISVVLGCGLALQIGSVVYYAWYVHANGYLPAPFIYNKLEEKGYDWLIHHEPVTA